VVNQGTPWSVALLGAIKLLGHELAVPSKNRVGLDDRGHFLQGLLPELLADLGEGCALTIAESHAPLPEIAKGFARCTRFAYDNLDQLLDRSTGANSANDCDTILTDA
jgi:hypothetical protein